MDDWDSVASDDELDDLENELSQTVVKIRILKFACALVLQANYYQVRRLAVLVNSSPQRRESFLNLQTARPQVLPISDVRTCWNSTFLMLIPALRLRSVIEVWAF
jgi:hypothetical protein